jgi:hypothetical protein
MIKKGDGSVNGGVKGGVKAPGTILRGADSATAAFLLRRLPGAGGIVGRGRYLSNP